MMYNVFKKEIEKIIIRLTENEKIDLNNEYCRVNNIIDDMIIKYTYIDCFFEDMKPSEVLDKLYECKNHKYFKWNGENITTFNYIPDNIKWQDIVDYCMDLEDDLSCDKLTKIIKMYQNLDDIKKDIYEELQLLGYPKNDISYRDFITICKNNKMVVEYIEYFNCTDIIEILRNEIE